MHSVAPSRRGGEGRRPPAGNRSGWMGDLLLPQAPPRPSRHTQVIWHLLVLVLARGPICSCRRPRGASLTWTWRFGRRQLQAAAQAKLHSGPWSLPVQCLQEDSMWCGCPCDPARADRPAAQLTAEPCALQRRFPLESLAEIANSATGHARFGAGPDSRVGVAVIIWPRTGIRGAVGRGERSTRDGVSQWSTRQNKTQQSRISPVDGHWS